MKKHNLISLILVVLFCLSPLAAFSEDVFVVIMKKQEEKKATRWSLAEWLNTKNRMGLMDQWLALHSSSESPFEFSGGGDFANYDLKNKINDGSLPTTTSNKANRGRFAAYVSIVGLEGMYESSDEKYTAYSALLNLRLLGTSMQSTNINIQYGMRNLKFDLNEYQNYFYGGSLTLYMMDFFGLDALTRFYIGKRAGHGTRMSGNLTELGGFIDISFIRIYGTWFKELLKFTEVTPSYTQTRTGVRAGLRFFF